ncbi:prepilin peptidase [Nocardiopsis baichengensis]|uniref:prepilin peptidase n=1 Tax=Nocardiopsis baichengensis TaxID=280240 RepID=UPI0003460F01|nr:A24 family peptidase [Nocardiopsis baichengensis]
MPTPLDLVLAAVLALVGAAVGAASGRLVRLFTPHEPEPGDESGPPPPACPHCAAPVPFLRALPAPAVRGFALRGACPVCGRALPTSAAVAAATGVLFGLVGLTAGAWEGNTAPVGIAALLFLAAVGTVLAAVDARVKRLPDVLVLRSYPLAAALVAAAALSSGPDWRALAGALGGGAGLFAFYFVLWFIHPAGMGWGDVKLSGLLGLYLGWQAGAGGVVSGTLLAFVGSAAVGLFLILLGKATRKTEIPLGPFMIGGALAVLVFGDPLAALTA